jgi:hypothetical protein
MLSRMSRLPLPSSAVGRFADGLLAADLPALDESRRRRTVEFIEQRVTVLPSVTRFGVRLIGTGVEVLSRLAGRRRVLDAVTSLPLPLVAEYPRLVRSLGYAYIWETWPATDVDGRAS